MLRRLADGILALPWEGLSNTSEEFLKFMTQMGAADLLLCSIADFFPVQCSDSEHFHDALCYVDEGHS